MTTKAWKITQHAMQHYFSKYGILTLNMEYMIYTDLSKGVWMALGTLLYSSGSVDKSSLVWVYIVW